MQKNYTQIILAIVALATAFVSGDYLDSVERLEHTQTITEDCKVIRHLNGTQLEECTVKRNIEKEL